MGFRRFEFLLHVLEFQIVEIAIVGQKPVQRLSELSIQENPKNKYWYYYCITGFITGKNIVKTRDYQF